MGFEVVRSGDKIDINLLHQNSEKIYKSSVFEFRDGSMIEIAMPTDGGKIVVFNLGVECQLYIYTSRGVYTCEASVERRYKRGNFFLLTMKLKTGLKKFQRREFFRVECLIDFAYYPIPDEVAESESVDDYYNIMSNPEYMEKKKLARTRDISGGGIRFTATESLEIGSNILTVIRLTNEKVDHMFYLMSEVISCELAPQVDDRWIIRARWKFRDVMERDLIIRYVFEEDRMKRKKENG